MKPNCFIVWKLDCDYDLNLNFENWIVRYKTTCEMYLYIIAIKYNQKVELNPIYFQIKYQILKIYIHHN